MGPGFQGVRAQLRAAHLVAVALQERDLSGDESAGGKRLGFPHKLTMDNAAGCADEGAEIHLRRGDIAASPLAVQTPLIRFSKVLRACRTQFN